MKRKVVILDPELSVSQLESKAGFVGLMNGLMDSFSLISIVVFHARDITLTSGV